VPAEPAVTGAEDRGRGLDAWCFTEACAGRELLPGCFVVRQRRSAALGLLITPWALLVREGDAYRRVPWRHVDRIELGSANPYEFVPADFLVARDAAGAALCHVACRQLAVPADALLEICGRFLQARRGAAAS
jgi:hypothetical protein